MKPRGSNRERSFRKPQQKPFRRTSDGGDQEARGRERRNEKRFDRAERNAREQRQDRAGIPPPSPFGGGRRREQSQDGRDARGQRGPRAERPAGRDDRHQPEQRGERPQFRGERGDRNREMRESRRERSERGSNRQEQMRRERPNRASFGGRSENPTEQRRGDRSSRKAAGEGRRRDELREGAGRQKRERLESGTRRDTGVERSRDAKEQMRLGGTFGHQAQKSERPERRQPRERKYASAAPANLQTAAIDGAVVVSRRGAQRVNSGNPWVYRSDIVSSNGLEPGAAAPVVDDRGRPLGTAFYSSSSQIAVRMISKEAVGSREKLLELIHERVRAAIAYRDKVVRDSDAYRVIFSEADLLPGLIVDRYNDVISLQALTQAMDREDIRAAVLDEILQHFAPAGILERVEPRIRELEQLPPREAGLLYGERSSTTFTMNGLKFAYDGLAGQKTGAFLDQRENYAAAAQYAHGEAIDICCYQGGFALHLARVCDQVTGVDISRPALEVADQNVTANSDALGGREVEWIEANAFELLRDYSDAGQQYDTIVLDPPAFAKSHKNLETALRGYKELNLRALKMLRPGGVLVTCSCSFHVSEFEFMQMLAEAAADVHRSLRIVEKRTQAKDHPVLLSHPESQYLKCIIAIAE